MTDDRADRVAAIFDRVVAQVAAGVKPDMDQLRQELTADEVEQLLALIQLEGEMRSDQAERTRGEMGPQLQRIGDALEAERLRIAEARRAADGDGDQPDP